VAGTNPGGGKRGGMIVGINVTPMVDVVLVLLVIMMVSATYVVAQSLKVDLPTSQQSDGSESSTAIVSVRANGDLLFNEEEVSEDALVERLRRASAESRELTLVVSADRKAEHGAVVHVMDLARRERITRFAVQVESAR
jgi:biopolymer transport protein ExbD